MRPCRKNSRRWPGRLEISGDFSGALIECDQPLSTRGGLIRLAPASTSRVPILAGESAALCEGERGADHDFSRCTDPGAYTRILSRNHSYPEAPCLQNGRCGALCASTIQFLLPAPPGVEGGPATDPYPGPHADAGIGLFHPKTSICIYGYVDVLSDLRLPARRFPRCSSTFSWP